MRGECPFTRRKTKFRSQRAYVDDKRKLRRIRCSQVANREAQMILPRPLVALRKAAIDRRRQRYSEASNTGP